MPGNGTAEFRLSNATAVSLGHVPLPVSNLTFLNLNLSRTTALDPWTANTYVNIITLITGFVLNGSLLLLFAMKPFLRTPFNIYLINLLIANTCTIIFQYPFDIASSFVYPTWPFGESSCTLYQYSIWILEAGMFNSHQLIALNRLWAVLHPYSYRTRHTVRFAVIMCLAMWLVVHAAMLPIIALDVVYYRLPTLTNGCYFNPHSQRTYDLTLNTVFFAWPMIVMWSILPIVLVAKFIRYRGRLGVVAPGQSHSNSATTPKRVVNSANISVQPGEVQPRRGRSVIRPHNTLVLAGLTVAISVSWTPITVYYFQKNFDQNYAATHESLLFVGLALFSIQTTVDPIVFVLALRPLQDAIREMFSRR